MSDYEAIIPFATSIGVQITSSDKDLVVGRLGWSEDKCTSFGVMHGGAIMALADTLGAVCAFLNLPDGANTSTIESKTNFFRPVTKAYVEGRAKPLHVGRTVIVAQTDLYDVDGKRVAQVTQTQAVLQPR